MDRRRASARFLIAAALALPLAAAADVPRLPIKEARWLAPASLVDGLTLEPVECFDPPQSASERTSATIGRILFRAPLLLGGQAARVGLSCASCHRNGRGNAHFSFPSISGHPGTADVTSSLMSKKRGDASFNPKPIPDLAASTVKVPRNPDKPDLKSFIRGLIVEEFDGEEPPAAVLDGLTAYVRAISPAACPRGDLANPVRLDRTLAAVDRAMLAAEEAWRSGDAATAGLLVGAARSTLGAIDERYQLPGLERGREQLRAADAKLRDLQHALASLSAEAAFQRWHRAWPRHQAEVRKYERTSLFSRSVLSRRLGLPAN